MKIAQITPVYPPKTGGIGEVAFAYANALSRAGHDVTVFCPKGEVTKTDSVRIFTLSPIYAWGHAAFLPQLIWKLKGYDIIHLHYPFYGASIFCALASVIWRSKLLVTYHMRPLANEMNKWQEYIFKIYALLIEPLELFFASAVFVSSIDYANSISLKHNNLIELPFFVDTDRFSPSLQRNVRSRFDISDDSCVIIFVGGLDRAHYFKGLEILLLACSGLSVNCNWDLLVVGDGDLKIKYEKIATDLGIKSRVHFLGRVAQSDLPSLYNSADVHVLPSINRCEAFGIVTLEAASSGLPSIVSNLPGVRTLVEEGVTGMICEPADEKSLRLCIIEILKDRERSITMGRKARRRIERYYSFSFVFNKLQEVYKRVKVF